MMMKRWLAVLCALLILASGIGITALTEADGEPPAAAEPAPKPAEAPKEQPKATEKPAETPKPTEKPTEAPKPAEKPTEAPKPAEAAVEAPKPAEEPKPAEAPAEPPKPEEKPAEPAAETPAETTPAEPAAEEPAQTGGQDAAEPVAEEPQPGTEAAEPTIGDAAQPSEADPAVEAPAGEETAPAEDAPEAGEAAEGEEPAPSLQVAVEGGGRYAMIGERALRYKLSVRGGVEPYSYSIVIEAKGKAVYATDVFSDVVMFKPKVFADHTLKLTVTDATGATATGQFTMRVSTNETNDALPLPKLGRTMNYAERLLAVAKSQVGYAESPENFIIEEDGKEQHWSFYGYESGMPYEEWCAMFVSWCLKQACVPEWMMPRCSNCYRWVQALGSRYFDNEDKYVPEPGDLIFFHHDRDDPDAHPEDKNFPNHVGIVVDYSERWQTVYTIEGNVGGKVVEKQYPVSDETIVGYTSMRYVMERWDPNYKSKTSLDKIEGIGFSVAAPKLATEDDD